MYVLSTVWDSKDFKIVSSDFGKRFFLAYSLLVISNIFGDLVKSQGPSQNMYNSLCTRAISTTLCGVFLYVNNRGNLIFLLITLKSTIQQHRSLWCLSCSFFAFFVTFFVGCNKRWKIWLSDNCCQGPPYTSTLYMFSIPDLDNNTARLWRAARWVWIFLFLIITDTVAIFPKIKCKTIGQFLSLKSVKIYCAFAIIICSNKTQIFYIV